MNAVSNIVAGEPAVGEGPEYRLLIVEQRPGRMIIDPLFYGSDDTYDSAAAAIEEIKRFRSEFFEEWGYHADMSDEIAVLTNESGRVQAIITGLDDDMPTVHFL